MKPRRVILTIELLTDVSAKVLAHVDRIDFVDPKSERGWVLYGSAIPELAKVNVVRATKPKAKKARK